MSWLFCFLFFLFLYVFCFLRCYLFVLILLWLSVPNIKLRFCQWNCKPIIQHVMHKSNHPSVPVCHVTGGGGGGQLPNSEVRRWIQHSHQKPSRGVPVGGARREPPSYEYQNAVLSHQNIHIFTHQYYLSIACVCMKIVESQTLRNISLFSNMLNPTEFVLWCFEMHMVVKLVFFVFDFVLWIHNTLNTIRTFSLSNFKWDDCVHDLHIIFAHYSPCLENTNHI